MIYAIFIIISVIILVSETLSSPLSPLLGRITYIA